MAVPRYCIANEHSPTPGPHTQASPGCLHGYSPARFAFELIVMSAGSV